MPRCIYLQFAGGLWTVDRRLGPGVWPLMPVYRTWELHAAQGAKIRRHGFTLLPDYASNARTWFLHADTGLAAGLIAQDDFDPNKLSATERKFGILADLMALLRADGRWEGCKPALRLSTGGVRTSKVAVRLRWFDVHAVQGEGGMAALGKPVAAARQAQMRWAGDDGKIARAKGRAAPWQ